MPDLDPADQSDRQTEHGAIPEPDVGASDTTLVARPPEAPSPDGTGAHGPLKVGAVKRLEPNRIRWLGFAIPISIALIASLTALLTYRVERHGAMAAESDQSAISATLTRQRVYADSTLQAAAAQATFEQWWQLRQLGAEYGPWCQPKNGLTNEAVVDGIIDCRLARATAAADLPGDVHSGIFSAANYASDIQAANRFTLDLDSHHYVVTANGERHAEMRVLLLAPLLAVALALCTLGQQAYRRGWRGKWSYLPLYLALPGWVIGVACAVLLTVWEV